VVLPLDAASLVSTVLCSTSDPAVPATEDACPCPEDPPHETRSSSHGQPARPALKIRRRDATNMPSPPLLGRSTPVDRGLRNPLNASYSSMGSASATASRRESRSSD